MKAQEEGVVAMAASIEGTTLMAGTRTSAARGRVSIDAPRLPQRANAITLGTKRQVILWNTLGKRLYLLRGPASLLWFLSSWASVGHWADERPTRRRAHRAR